MASGDGPALRACSSQSFLPPSSSLPDFSSKLVRGGYSAVNHEIVYSISHLRHLTENIQRQQKLKGPRRTTYRHSIVKVRPVTSCGSSTWTRFLVAYTLERHKRRSVLLLERSRLSGQSLQGKHLLMMALALYLRSLYKPSLPGPYFSPRLAVFNNEAGWYTPNSDSERRTCQLCCMMSCSNAEIAVHVQELVSVASLVNG